MEDIFIQVINYIYMLGAIAFVLEYLVSKERGEALALKLIDWSIFLSHKNFDKLVSKVSLYFSEKYDRIYGQKYFGMREWIASAAIAFTYCYIFYIAEKSIGFESTLLKQLGFWFIPNLIADIISINFTRWILKKVYLHPEKYFQYLIYDILTFILCFYICFSFTMIYLAIFSNHTYLRILLHPMYLFMTAMNNFPDPMAIDALFVLLIASTTFIPTLLHVIFVSTSLLIKTSIPFLHFFVHSLIEKMISFERHPIGVVVIICGVCLLPFIIIGKVVLAS